MFFFLKVALFSNLKSLKKAKARRRNRRHRLPTQVLGAAVGAAAFFVALQVLEVKRWVAGAGKVLCKQGVAGAAGQKPD